MKKNIKRCIKNIHHIGLMLLTSLYTLVVHASVGTLNPYDPSGAGQSGDIMKLGASYSGEAFTDVGYGLILLGIVGYTTVLIFDFIKFKRNESDLSRLSTIAIVGGAILTLVIWGAFEILSYAQTLANNGAA